ncbi:MAG TPA: copper chaperone PCu(A)C [Steroidobacteraceae bacterium]|nr:copper chaperone PCu(A)C [Steroidobacteraceae bacterium]
MTCTARSLFLAWAAAVVIAAPASAAEAPVATDAWSRATPPGSDVAAVYLTLRGGVAADRLTGASTARATMAHLHSMQDTGNMSGMRPVDGIDIPAGTVVALAPRGLHLMLMGLSKPLVGGEHFSVTLHFAKGGDRAVDVRVLPATAADPTVPANHP